LPSRCLLGAAKIRRERNLRALNPFNKRILLQLYIEKDNIKHTELGRQVQNVLVKY
jgi:hypothetical protein